MYILEIRIYHKTTNVGTANFEISQSFKISHPLENKETQNKPGKLFRNVY